MNMPLQRRSQHGAFSILSAFTLMLAILFLALVVDAGRLYLEQRNLQRIADTAALESISRLESGNCSQEPAKAQSYALENASSYGFAMNDLQSLSTSCVSINSVDSLLVTSPDAATGRAVEVITSSQVPASIIIRTGSLFGFPGNATVRLQAIAVAEKDSDPMAVFSVGAQLLNLGCSASPGLVPSLLKTVGADICLTLLDWEGLLETQVTPAGLLQALGVDLTINQLKALTPEGLVELEGTKINLIDLPDLINASASLITNNDTLAANIAALGVDLLSTELKNAKVNLLGTADQPGILQIVTGPGQALGSALDAKLNLGDVLSTSLMTAVQGRGLLVDQLSLLNGTLAVKMGIVEPPAIGIGPVGTTAYNAQIRLQANVDSSKLLGGLLEPLLSLKLPIILDLVNTKGELADIDCSLPEPEITIDVESRVGNICIGTMPSESLWSTKASCTEANTQETPILKLLGLDLVKGKAAVPLLSTGVPRSVTLAEQESETTEINKLNIGTSVSKLLSEVLKMIRLGAPKTSNGSPGFTTIQAAQIAEKYLSENSYNKEKAKAALEKDNIDWARPAVIIFSTTMLEEWSGKLLGVNCAIESNKSKCRNELANSLQTKAQNGLLGSLLTGIANLLGLGSDSQPLLLTILEPIIKILEPLLNEVGNSLSTLLTALGLNLGQSEIKVHSISCGIPRLVQ
ncbi:pilus assembly protein TadG-related protein [Phytopseudomonas daroniae]|nr:MULTISPECIES: pilus assembly protein TadG-related protein [Pseudomonas]